MRDKPKLKRRRRICRLRRSRRHRWQEEEQQEEGDWQEGPGRCPERYRLRQGFHPRPGIPCTIGIVGIRRFGGSRDILDENGNCRRAGGENWALDWVGLWSCALRSRVRGGAELWPGNVAPFDDWSPWSTV
jgi:hypothetical protein